MRDRIWFVVPAAGASRRLGGSVPKQYLQLRGRSVIEHSLSCLLDHPGISGGAVALADGDECWDTLPAALRERIVTTRGGAERCHSVLAGLAALIEADEQDWVLVHDAARPCLDAADLERLISRCWDDSVGGLLAVPVADALKCGDAHGRAVGSLQREGTWRAQTPQMFRHGQLVWALRDALEADVMPNDESAAIERSGLRPLLVEGSPSNIKITHAADLALAAEILAAREEKAR